MSFQKRRKIAETVTGEESTGFARHGELQRRCGSHKNDIFAVFSQLKSERKTCDFVIKFGKEEIHVHRAVLAASSRYYERLFTEDSEEKGFVEFGIAPETGKQCIDYIYTGKVQLSCKNPEKLIHASELMELTSLTDMYLEFLKEKLGAGNCLKFVLFAETCAHQSFTKFFESFTPEEFSSIVSSNNVASLTQSLLEQCLEAASHCKVNLETIKWNGMVKWVKADETRKSAFCHLFTLVNFKKLPEKFIKEEMSKEQLIRDSSQCLKIVFDAICTKKSATSPTHIILCHTDSRLLLQYDLSSKNCSRLSQIPIEMFNYGNMDLVSSNGDVYIGTGNSLSRFSGNKWTEMMQSGNQCYCRCVVHGSLVYMVTNSSVIEYNTDTETWEQIQTSLGFGEGFSVATSGTHLYAIGGANGYKSAKEYGFQSRTWEPISSMKYERKGGRVVIFEGKLYAIGGTYTMNPRYSTGSSVFGGGNLPFGSVSEKSEYTSIIESYEPGTDTWLDMSHTLQCSNCNFKAFAAKDRIFIVGGKKCSENLEILDFQKKK